MSVLSKNESLPIPQCALVLKKYFDTEAEWDHPDKGITGPVVVEIEFDEILGKDRPKSNHYGMAELPILERRFADDTSII